MRDAISVPRVRSNETVSDGRTLGLGKRVHFIQSCGIDSNPPSEHTTRPRPQSSGPNVNRVSEGVRIHIRGRE